MPIVMRPTSYEEFFEVLARKIGAAGALGAKKTALEYIEMLGKNVRMRQDVFLPSQDPLEMYGASPYIEEIAGVINKRGNPMGDIATTAGQYAMFGRKTFFFHPGLCRELSSTKCLGLARFLSPPYPCAFYSLGEPLLTLKGENDKRGHFEVPVNGFYVKKVQHRDSTSVLRFEIMSESRDKGFATAAFEFPLDRVESDSFLIDRQVCREVVRGIGLEKEREDIAAEHVELLFNCMFYLNSTSREIRGPVRAPLPSSKKLKNKKKLRRLERHAGRASKEEYYDVGHSIKVNKQVAMERTNKGGPSCYSYRFTVRGHFRNQAYGPGWKEHKLTWIPPHWKGPDKAAVIHRRYEVTKEA